ncbi:MAG: alanine dehydrogenase, partial [Zetaproteobacteria bacterium]|nr:alanine dehydrogenase [Zetaproteobacteria bacterium]
MQIGVPKEIKNGEHRVALTPHGVQALVRDGHRLVVQTGAGVDSGFSDALYRHAGATVTEKAEDAWGCDLVVKVKEPLAEEYHCLNA